MVYKSKRTEETINDDNTIPKKLYRKNRSQQYIDIRQYWKPDDSDNYLPTKSGITIPTDDTTDEAEVLHAQLGEAIAFLAEKDEKGNGR